MLGHASWAAGSPITFSGIHAKNGAGAGQTISRGSTALLQNPANLIYSRAREPYLDVGLGTIDYSYQRNDTVDPVIVREQTPPVTVGFSMRPMPKWAFGAVYNPTAIQRQKSAAGVPMIVGDNVNLFDIESEETSSIIAAGTAYRFNQFVMIGFTAHRLSEQVAITAVDQAGATNDAAIDALYGGGFMRYGLGLRSEVLGRRLVLAGTILTPVVKDYSGDVYVAATGSRSYDNFDGVGYEPGKVSLGAEMRFGSVAWFADGSFENWAAGRNVARIGFPADPAGVDYRNTFSVAAGMKLWVAGAHMVTAAAGYYPGNKGFGRKLGEPALQADGSLGDPLGMAYGDMQAISRRVFGAGYRLRLARHGYVKTGLAYQKGERSVPAEYFGAGDYELEVVQGSLAVAYGF